MELRKLYFTLLATTLFISNMLAQNQDCTDAFKVCSLGTYHSEQLTGFGKVQENNTSSTCSDSFLENHSYWLEWKVQEAGIITFTIDPSDPNDDIDFILYKKGESCKKLTEVRCMASGRSYGNAPRSSSNCQGSTGLQLTSSDAFESSGCKYNDDNYLKFLQAEIGESFVLFINNYTSTNPVSITFDGTAKLEEHKSCTNEKIEKKLSISNVFPNPAQQEISIAFNAQSDNEFTIEVLSLKGELLLQKKDQFDTSETIITLDINDFAAGTYIVRLRQDALSSSKKFTKI